MSDDFLFRNTCLFKKKARARLTILQRRWVQIYPPRSRRAEFPPQYYVRVAHFNFFLSVHRRHFQYGAIPAPLFWRTNFSKCKFTMQSTQRPFLDLTTLLVNTHVSHK